MELIVPWLRANTRDFGYSTSRVEQDARGDIVIVTEECAKLVTQGAILRPEAFMRGAQAHDFARGAVGRRQAQAQATWSSALGPKAPPIEFPLRHMTRAHMLAEFPDGLLSLTWSCRMPQSLHGQRVPCRECRTCREMAAHGVPLARPQIGKVA